MPQTKKWVIFDLDNCVCDDEHRIHLIKTAPPMTGDRWDAYHAACGGDTVNPEAVKKLGMYQHAVLDCGVIVFTGRDVRQRGETLRWLDKHFVKPDIIMMRNVGDHIGAVAMKQRMLGYLEAHEGIRLTDVLHAYDDRQDIVDMYFSHGIQATRLFIHERPAGHPTQPDMKPWAADPITKAQIQQSLHEIVESLLPQWQEGLNAGVLHDHKGKVLGGYNCSIGSEIATTWLEGSDARVGRYISKTHAKAAVEEALKNAQR